jgi:hypothetical protein
MDNKDKEPEKTKYAELKKKKYATPISKPR